MLSYKQIVLVKGSDSINPLIIDVQLGDLLQHAIRVIGVFEDIEEAHIASTEDQLVLLVDDEA